VFDKSTNEWKEAGRTGDKSKNNLAYPFGLGTQQAEAAPFINAMKNKAVLLHPYNDIKGRAYLGFELTFSSGAAPAGSFVGEITATPGGQCELPESAGKYTIQPLKVVGLSDNDVVEFENDGDRQPVFATNTLEYNGGNIGGQIQANPDENCTLTYTHTPIVIGQRVIVHTGQFRIFGNAAEDITVYFFSVAPDICVDCCTDEGLLAMPQGTTTTIPTSPKQNLSDIISEMLT